MPELPEVETVIRSIRGTVVDCKISKFPRFPHLEGQSIVWIDRRGKYIIFCLDQGYLVSHLRMTGQWFLNDSTPEDKHYRWGMDLEGPFNGHLWFRDIRKFGTLDWVETSLKGYKPLDILGPDGMDLPGYTAEFVQRRMAKSSKPIKNLLLDQSVIAGPGNIYVCELLWYLGINPEKPAKECVDKAFDICNLFHKIFEEAIEEGGCSVSDYLGGKYHEKLKVYGKTGEPCFQCGTSISRIVQSGRSTFYCSYCQV